MPRKQETGEGKLHPKPGRLRRAASSVARVFRRGDGHDSKTIEPGHSAQRTATMKRIARPAHLESDIPLERIEEMYSPTQTSIKAPFRVSGEDHQRDQEFAGGVADDRWNDEDRFTNKSGDPRIGTHRRTYEPGEARAARGRNDENE
jgi:hypothetical protein